MEAFRKPQIDNYIHRILMVNLDLYDKAEIGNRIEKLPNGNKCYLYKNDSVFRYNCLVIPEKIREIVEIEEWDQEELGFYKDRKSTRLNSSHVAISYAVFCLKKKISN